VLLFYGGKSIASAGRCQMPLTLTWADVTVRTLLTLVAGAAIGFDRGERGQVAGLRTTLLVSLAACLSMVQANWLTNSIGRTPDSFVVLDLMRLPLGIPSATPSRRGDENGGALCEMHGLFKQKSRLDVHEMPPVIAALTRKPEVVRLEWRS
jgi:hypothetical protein